VHGMKPFLIDVLQLSATAKRLKKRFATTLSDLKFKVVFYHTILSSFCSREFLLSYGYNSTI